MPTYKVVLFADSSKSVQTQYMRNQQSAIQDAIPDLVVELVDETDPRLNRYSIQSRQNRVPAALVLKDDARVQMRNFKLEHPEAIKWIKGIMGIS